MNPKHKKVLSEINSLNISDLLKLYEEKASKNFHVGTTEYNFYD